MVFYVKQVLSMLIGLALIMPSLSSAQFAPFATFEVGEGVVESYTTTATQVTPFTTIMFDGEFETPPIVFTMTPEFSGVDDPCILRVDNIQTDSFDVTCLESVNEDRAIGVDIPFNYIAIQEAGVTVPLVNGIGDGSDDVNFQVACNSIDAEVFGPTCTSCTGAQGVENITFDSAFNDSPALLTQLQAPVNRRTTAPIGEPVFISAGVQTGSLSATGYNVSVDRMESEFSALSEETICHLAVERSGCQEVDFSSIGGLASVDFEALHGGNVDGHDNGCTTGEGATFSAGCFSSTPIVVAAGHERAGNNGGWLRVCDVNTTESIFTFDEDTVSDAERAHIDEDISVLAFGELFTTPVTLNSAKVSLFNRIAKFEWETTAETFHLGFNLWGETNNGWVQLNRKLIASNGSDTDQVKLYRRKVWLTRQQANEISNFGISSVDSTGHEEFYGPFKEDQPYGEEANNEPVDWTQTRNSFEQSMRERGFVKVNNKWRRLSARSQAKLKDQQLGVNRSQFEIKVESTGIHSIGADQLLALNPSWNRQLLRNIALTLNGKALPRHIISDDNRLDENDQIVFNALAPQGNDTPFLEHYTYRLNVDRSNVVQASRYNGAEVSEGASLENTALLEKTLTSKKLHSAGLTTGDPWYDSRLLSTGNVASVEYIADFDEPIQTDRAGQLDVLLFGSLDFPGEGDDHHVQVYVNDQLVRDLRFDGLIEQRLTLPINAGLLGQTGNVVRIDVVGDTGFFADVVLVDEITIAAFSVLSQDTRPVLDFADLNDADGYQVSSRSATTNQVYAYTSRGLLSSVEAKNSNGTTAFTRLPFEVSSSNEAELRYAVGAVNDWATPSNITVVKGQDLHSQEADYLIVAHPAFIGNELSEFVEFKQELGYKVRVIDWLELVDTYGYGNNTPTALNNFLSKANGLYSTDNVLIVGGHTYDYFGITDDSIVNFVPSHYRPVSVFEYTATDNPYADLDGDNLPEIAIGRWPVRSIADLKTIIKKTKDWHQNRQDDPYQDAYLVAQATDGQNLDFTEQLSIRIQAPLSRIEGIESTSILSLGDLPDGVSDAVAFTRSSLTEEINNGVDIVSFSGHGSPTAWGFQNIINTDFIKGLENQGEPVLLMPLACYITHYESVTTNTLAHQWLFAGDIGAAAIHGASVLGEYRENALFAERYVNLSQEVTTVGEAILKAKQSVGSNNEILHNWVLLGDPALPVR